MAVCGYLSDFSLPELFKWLGQGRRTGVLTIFESASSREFGPVDESFADSSSKPHDDWPTSNTVEEAGQIRVDDRAMDAVVAGEMPEVGIFGEAAKRSAKPRSFIWFYEGRIVAYINRQGPESISLGEHLNQLSEPGEWAIQKMQLLRPEHIPLGQWLQSQGVLQAEQLQQLFRERVIQPIARLLTLSQGAFRFQRQDRLPLIEMTGLSIPPGVVTLVGLRQLQDWSQLKRQLPDARTILLRCGSPAGLQLTALEQEIWNAANGRRRLEAVACQSGCPVPDVQQVALRLNQVGLLDWSDLPLGEAADVLADGLRRHWLPAALAQVIGRAEAQSPLAELPPLAEMRNYSKMQP